MYAAVARAREVLAEEDLVLDQYTAFAQLLATFHEEDHHPDVRTHATHATRHTRHHTKEKGKENTTHDTQIP
jgi:hypothetical protein